VFFCFVCVFCVFFLQCPPPPVFVEGGVGGGRRGGGGGGGGGGAHDHNSCKINWSFHHSQDIKLAFHILGHLVT